MKRPAGLTVIGVGMMGAAVVLALGCLASFFIAAMGITEGLSGDAVSNAIVGMAMGGGFSLLILAMVAAGLADGVFKMREMGVERIHRVDWGGYGVYRNQHGCFPEIRVASRGAVGSFSSACGGDGGVDAGLSVEAQGEEGFWSVERIISAGSNQH
jgi:hypothetical protein